MRPLLCLTLLLALAVPAVAQDDDLTGFDPIAELTVAQQQRGTKVRGTVTLRPETSDVVARVLRNGKLLGRVEYPASAAGELVVVVPLFRSARKLLGQRGSLKVRLEVAAGPPDDPPERASRVVRLRP